MQGLDRKFHIFPINQHRYFDLGGCNHLDVDALVRQHFEHFGGHTGVAAHADANDGDLGHIRVGDQIVEIDLDRKSVV